MAKISREKFKVLEGVFDEFTLNTLEVLRRKKYFDEFGKPIKTGKEGDVYFAFKDDKVLAVKIFRMTTANFKKISHYIVRDFRFRNIKGSLRKVILVWAQKEFRNLLLCHKNNMNVPYPYKQVNNVILMDYIEGTTLNNVTLEEPEKFFEMLIEQMKLMKNEAKLVHGDLSEYNIMVENGIPYIIDMGQSMSVKNEEDLKNVYDLYERDIKNVVKHFNKKYNMNLDLDEVMKRLGN